MSFFPNIKMNKMNKPLPRQPQEIFTNNFIFLPHRCKNEGQPFSFSIEDRNQVEFSLYYISFDYDFDNGYLILAPRELNSFYENQKHIYVPLIVELSDADIENILEEQENILANNSFKENEDFFKDAEESENNNLMPIEDVIELFTPSFMAEEKVRAYLDNATDEFTGTFGDFYKSVNIVKKAFGEIIPKTEFNYFDDLEKEAMKDFCKGDIVLAKKLYGMTHKENKKRLLMAIKNSAKLGYSGRDFDWNSIG